MINPVMSNKLYCEMFKLVIISEVIKQVITLTHYTVTSESQYR